VYWTLILKTDDVLLPRHQMQPNNFQTLESKKTKIFRPKYYLTDQMVSMDADKQRIAQHATKQKVQNQ
jgi:hypothetical protein